MKEKMIEIVTGTDEEDRREPAVPSERTRCPAMERLFSRLVPRLRAQEGIVYQPNVVFTPATTGP